MKKQLSIRTITSVAVLSAVAFVLAFFEFPVPLSPSFARMDNLLCQEIEFLCI